MSDVIEEVVERVIHGYCFASRQLLGRARHMRGKNETAKTK
jgi:hypothetical protein